METNLESESDSNHKSTYNWYHVTYLNSMRFSVFIYKVGIIQTSKSHRMNVKIKWDDI